MIMIGIVWYNKREEGIRQMEQIEEDYRISYNINPESKTRGTTTYSLIFPNGDYWTLVPANTNARGHSCNISYIDRSIPASTVQTIIYPATRRPPYTAYHFYGKPAEED